MSSQYCFLLAELGSALMKHGCAKRSTMLRDVLASAIPRLPAGRELASYVAEGDTMLGVLWRNYYCLLLSVAGGAESATHPHAHPDCADLQPKPVAGGGGGGGGGGGRGSKRVSAIPRAMPPPPMRGGGASGVVHAPPPLPAEVLEASDASDASDDERVGRPISASA